MQVTTLITAVCMLFMLFSPLSFCKMFNVSLPRPYYKFVSAIRLSMIYKASCHKYIYLYYPLYVGFTQNFAMIIIHPNAGYMQEWNVWRKNLAPILYSSFFTLRFEGKFKWWVMKIHFSSYISSQSSTVCFAIHPYSLLCDIFLYLKTYFFKVLTWNYLQLKILNCSLLTRSVN